MPILPLVMSGMVVMFASGCAAEGTLWTFDRLDGIGGAPAHVEGPPRIIETQNARPVRNPRDRDRWYLDAFTKGQA